MLLRTPDSQRNIRNYDRAKLHKFDPKLQKKLPSGLTIIGGSVCHRPFIRLAKRDKDVTCLAC